MAGRGSQAARGFALLGGAIIWISTACPAFAGAGGQEVPQRAQLSAEQVFALADAARDRGDVSNAETAYRALAGDPDPQIRAEARFRLAMMFGSLGRHAEAAILFRRILDEQPGTQRVRLELARVLEALGDEAGARRALREAQAGGLPPDVARLVDRYSAALRSRKPLGASLELAIAPDSNINRSTRSTTLGTVIGDFTLDEDARQTSGIGLSARGQAYARHDIGRQVSLLGQVGTAADLYRNSIFNDVRLSIAVGPEMRIGRDRIATELGMSWRWFGGDRYSTMRTAGINFFHPLDRQSQLRLTALASAIDNARNRLQGGQGYTVSLTYERALSSRAGIALSIAVDRQDLRDPGYSTTNGNVTLLAYREIGAATLAGTASYGRLEADERLAIYPRRRADDFYRASLAITYRRLRIGGFSPLVRVTAEYNHSNIELYQYRRLRTEFGLVRAF